MMREVADAPPIGAPGVFIETPYPRVAMLWRSTRADDSLEAVAKHDLTLVGPGRLGLAYDANPVGAATGFTVESQARSREAVAELRALNPDIVVLCEIYFYEWSERWLPADHSWWMRKDGERVQFWPGTFRMDWYNAEYRQRVVEWTMSLRDAGVDGVFYDNLRPEPEPWVAFLGDVREAVGGEFLILANAGYAVGAHDFAAPYLNGVMYESGWSHGRTEWDETVADMRHTETLLRHPKISVVERFEEQRSGAGWPGDAERGQKPPADPAARRWSLCFSLVVGDFYYLFADDTSHAHDWYPEYDAKIGRPLAPGEQVSEHVWRRRYEGATVVVNLPGASEPYVVRLDAAASDTLSDDVGTTFALPPADGRILLTS